MAVKKKKVPCGPKWKGTARTEDEVYAVLDKCMEAIEEGSSYSGQSYEEGLQTAIDWLSGDVDCAPFED